MDRSYKSEQLHCRRNIVRRHASLLRDVAQLDISFTPMRVQVLEHYALPEGMVRHSTEIRKRFLRRSRDTFDLGQQVTEFYKKPAKTLSLILRQCHDAGHVVPLSRTVFLLAEVTDQMTAVFVVFGHSIKEKRFYVIIESLVIQK